MPPSPPNPPVSSPPPGSPPPPDPGRPLEYGHSPGPRNNVWWKVCLRIVAGMALGVGSVAAGGILYSATNFPPLFYAPPAVMFAALVFVAVRFRRFGYVSGFFLGPFIVAASLVIMLLIICGKSLH